ncbi:MAG: class I SAM-dependent methyltransferase, partial [Oxalobacter sp.]|nr:class I SAM-dependent methyltransferase [Oxalobacter sp.]
MKPTPSMHDWLVSPTGQYMLRWEERYFHTLTEDIFGYNAVQIGLTELDALKENRITHHWYSNPFLPKTDMADPCQHNHDAVKGLNGHLIPVSLTHTCSQLPYATESIDLVVLPHALDLAQSPHQLLREIHRILIPEGQLIISGFNP